MLAGRLSVPNGSLLIEAFIHDGRTYTYFGLFPSLLRIPVLVLTHSLDGRLTALSMLAAWLVTALFAPLLIWRVRVFSRGQVPLGATETVALGALVGAMTGGSVLVFLAASPNVFSEDLAWSVALTLGSLFALLGVLERPSRRRVVFSGVLILAANLTRAPTGYACVIGAVLVSIWFASGQSGAENRRWWAPVLAAGIVPLAVGCAVNMAKFGVLFGRPNGYFGGPNGGPEFSLRYLPSTLAAYLRPDAIRFTPVFPFITLPVQVAQGVGGDSVFGQRPASLTATMPLLFLLALWGSIIAFRLRAVSPLRAIRLLLIAAGVATGATLIFGYLNNRYLADFLPLLIVGAAVGAVSIWARLGDRRRRARVVVACLFVGVALLEVVANTALAVTPADTWSPVQTLHYVEAQQRVSDLTGHPLAENVQLGYALPNWAPADRLFVVGYCERVYIPDGDPLPNFPFNLGSGWLLVERGPHGSLCPTLVHDRLTPVLRTSLVRADAAFLKGYGIYRLAILKSAILAVANPQLIALRQFNVSLQHLVNVGLPGARARAVTAKLLADTASLQGALAKAASQNQQSDATVAAWTRDVVSQWGRMTSDYTSLLHELVAAAPAPRRVVQPPPTAQPPSTQPPATHVYVVQPGDTLWALAARYLGDPLRYQQLFALNRGISQVDGFTLVDPNLIYPGMKLVFPADAIGLPPPAP